ncbi:Radical SAM domain protein [uncultured Desulfobacterium sp.]|uniref:Radical SAM domain protein n=1 Tax=uncultured Desulfobacterium sp. TaxID=201089 RepID=A0A445N0E1_9BACT|nr:Radical SAM domain protein [uncultured Desulfobacterium sp.]
MTEPSYLRLYRKGELAARVKSLLELISPCRLCPRQCGADRLAGETGFCSTGRRARVASFNAHFGEEDPLVGTHGSGTIFISSCNLLCSFCQNYEISHLAEGEEITADEMASMMIHLQQRGCHNINFVTPTHVAPQIVEALIPAVEQGLDIPLVYNCGGYDSKETLALLDGVFDIYMPDFKFWDDTSAKRFCNTDDYRMRAIEAIREMHRQVGDLVLDRDGIAIKGLLVRHLVMPNNVAGTEKIMDFLATEISKNTYVNVMDQYRPCGAAHEDEMINRRLTAGEYIDAVEAAKKAGLTRLDPRIRPRLIFMR